MLLETAPGVSVETVREKTGARFAVDFQYLTDTNGVILENGDCVAFDNTGIDRVEFWVQTNPGTKPGPLMKVASGGELARISLAISNTRATEVPARSARSDAR